MEINAGAEVAGIDPCFVFGQNPFNHVKLGIFHIDVEQGITYFLLTRHVIQNMEEGVSIGTRHPPLPSLIPPK